MPDRSHSTKRSRKRARVQRHYEMTLLERLSRLAAQHEWEAINPGSYSPLVVKLIDRGLAAIRSDCIAAGITLDLIGKIMGGRVVTL